VESENHLAPSKQAGFIWVYIFAPLVGGSIAAGCFRFIIAPMIAAKIATMACECSAAAALNGSRENREGNCQP
jgi:glycerol uptake facilitator-like aquaporin